MSLPHSEPQSPHMQNVEDEADIIPGYEDETPPPVMPVGHREHANSQHARSEGCGEMRPRTELP